jgi:hypothetical protein
MKKPHWTLAMALAWLISRDPDKVRACWNDYRRERWVWRHRENRVPPDSRVEAGWHLEKTKPVSLHDVWIRESTMDDKSASKALEMLWNALHWRQYPAWRSLSLTSRALLVEILQEYRPGQNGRLEWSCRKAGQAIGVSKNRAARALTQLECLGWLKVERIALFGRRNAPACYALTMYVNDVTGDPASFAFEHIDPDNPLLGPFRVAPEGRHGRISGTQASRLGDTRAISAGLKPISDALKSSRIFKDFAANAVRRAKG